MYYHVQAGMNVMRVWGGGRSFQDCDVLIHSVIVLTPLRTDGMSNIVGMELNGHAC